MNSSRFSNLELDGKAPGGKMPSAGSDAPDMEPGGAAHHLARGDKFLAAGLFEHALRAYSAALGEDPACLDGWVGQLLMLLEMEEYPETVLWADKAMDTFPGHPQLLAVKSAALYRMGSHSEARDINDFALKTRGDQGLVWLFRGELNLARSLPSAEACFRKARAGQKCSNMRLFIGSILLRYGKYPQALLELQAAVAEHSKAAWAWHLLGRAQEKTGQLQQAEVSYRQAVDLSPNNPLFRAALNRKQRSLATKIINGIKGVFRT